MRELDLITIIKNSLDDASFIGDDCAFLEDFDLYFTQDTLVEDVHFSLYTTTPYLLGRKSVSVNLSDLASAFAVPKYISVSISLPKTVKDIFVSELYRGINDVCREFGVKVIGGDITGSDKVMISISAIGKRTSLFNVSRKYAKKDDVIVVTGEFGSSGAALNAFCDFLVCDDELKQKHLNPTPRIKEGLKLAALSSCNLAATDCSDGLISALYNIAVSSKRSIKIDINKVPVNPKMIEYCKVNGLDYKQFVKWGGEDYELLICMPEALYNELNPEEFIKIGHVLNKDNTPVIMIKDGEKTETLTKKTFEEKSFNHF